MRQLFLLFRYADTGLSVAKKRGRPKARFFTLVSIAVIGAALSSGFHFAYHASQQGETLAIAQLTATCAMLLISLAAEFLFQIVPGPRTDLLRTLPLSSWELASFFILESLLQVPLFLAMPICVLIGSSDLTAISIAKHLGTGLWLLGLTCLLAVTLAAGLKKVGRFVPLQGLPWIMNLLSVVVLIGMSRTTKPSSTPSPTELGVSMFAGLATDWNPAQLALSPSAFAMTIWTGFAVAVAFFGHRSLMRMETLRAPSQKRTAPKSFKYPQLKRQFLTIFRTPSLLYVASWPFAVGIASSLTGKGAGAFILPFFLILGISGAIQASYANEAAGISQQLSFPMDIFKSFQSWSHLWLGVYLTFGMTMIGSLHLLSLFTGAVAQGSAASAGVALLCLPGLLFGMSWISSWCALGIPDLLTAKQEQKSGQWRHMGILLVQTLATAASLSPAMTSNFRIGKGGVALPLASAMIGLVWFPIGWFFRSRARHRLTLRIQEITAPE